MARSTVTSKGQITIPKVVREQLQLRTGDKIDFRIDPDGDVRMRPLANKVKDVFGALSHKTSHVRSTAEINRSVADAFKHKKL